MRYYIDEIGFFKGGMSVGGWAENHAACNPPTLLYNGISVKTVCSVVDRPDLIAQGGNEARAWGFRIAALTGEDLPSLDNVRLFISNEVIQLQGVMDAEDNNYTKMMNMYIEEIKEKPTGVLLEIGSRARSGNTYRHLFPDTIKYIGLDVTAGSNVDIVGDAHHISRHLDIKFDFVFSISTFEHLLMPWKAVIEINKVMSPGGLIFTQSHQTWPIHETPWDYWRFTRDGWHGLFNRHTGFKVAQTSYAQRAHISPVSGVNAATAPLLWEPAYLVTACVARKIGEPTVSWDGEVGEVADLAYSWGSSVGNSGKSP
jgi:Methyltransferase domain